MVQLAARGPPLLPHRWEAAAAAISTADTLSTPSHTCSQHPEDLSNDHCCDQGSTRRRGCQKEEGNGEAQPQGQIHTLPLLCGPIPLLSPALFSVPHQPRAPSREQLLSSASPCSDPLNNPHPLICLVQIWFCPV